MTAAKLEETIPAPPESEAELRTLPAPSVDAVTHPLVMVDDQKVLPRDYIVHHRSQRCLNCGTTHEWCDTYARNEVPAHFNIGTVQNLVPIQRFRFNLPVRIVKIEARPVPVCQECVGQIDLSSLPDPRSTDEWHAIVRRKAAQEAAAKVKKPPKGEKKAPPTIQDIIDLL